MVKILNRLKFFNRHILCHFIANKNKEKYIYIQFLSSIV
ncbi:hypothetical protein GASC598B02_009150, partial [Gilliamella apicola SCGC AB-598-B02]